MSLAVVAIGSNLGDRAANVRAAFHELRALSDGEVVHSRLYGSAAWGDVSQPDYVNAVAMFETQRDPHALLDALLDIERRFGRVRSAERRYAARYLDLDLIALGARHIHDSHLTLPHPHAHVRAFVLVPLAEIAPTLVLPGHGAIESLLKPEFVSLCWPLASTE